MFVMCRYVYDVWVCLWCMGMFVMCGYDYNVLLPNVTWLGKSYNITGLNRTLGLQKFEPPRISTESAHECGKVVSPTDWPSAHSRKYPWYLFPLETESIPRPYWCQKDYVTKKWLHPIEPATFRFVKRCLNQRRHRVTITRLDTNVYSKYSYQPGEKRQYLKGCLTL